MDTLRQDIGDARATEHSGLHAARFLVEIVASVGLVLRHMCYFAAAYVFESVRLGREPVFDDDYNVTVRWSWLGPGWEHNSQSRWEIWFASLCCVICGFWLYTTLALFPLTLVERSLLWVTCGALVVDPAWTHIYLTIQSQTGQSD